MSRYPMYGVQDEGVPVWSRGGSVLDSQGGHQQGYNPYGYSPQMGGGGGGHTTIIHSHTKPQSDADIYKVGIYGWRKRCLYGFILLLTLFVVLNIALTLWIMSVLDFSSEGMGALKMDEDGVRITGRAQFDLPVHFSQLSTARDEALTIDSYRGVHLQSRNLSGDISSRFSLGQEGRTTAVCDKFEIFDKTNKLLFYADSNEVGLKLENLRILDEGGSVFEGAIQTSLLRPEADTPLRLESPTRGIVVDAAQDIEVLSSAGEINVNSLLDMNIVSKQGKIRLESSAIYMEGLGRSNGRGINQYQVCVCHNGRLFMAEQGADCRADRMLLQMEFTRERVLWSSLAFRFCLVAYSPIHDYLFKVRFTDIDYSVYHDAAMAVASGGSPYQRATYRYSPLLAWLLLPNAVFAAFGKLLFCSADILVGWICLRLGDERRKRSGEEKSEGDSLLLHSVLFWLANPLTMIISARGNADSLVVAAVLATLLLVERGRWYTAAVVHGAVAVQLKLYPILLLVPLYLHSIHRESGTPIMHILNLRHGSRSIWERVKMLINGRGLLYALITIVSFGITQLLFYKLYGDEFLYESLIYHFKRIDIRHNFSIYFYPLYLAEGNEWMSALISKGAFIPQLVCILIFSIRYSRDLAFSSFLSLYAFVSLNKVCTSQYFVWYISFLPVIASRIEMSHTESAVLILLWWIGQGQWLLPAYLFEFRGLATLEWIWMASLGFLCINMYIIIRLCTSYRERLESVKTKKSQ